MMFRLRSGLRGSQSRMARPTPSQPLREQGKICAGPRPSQGISNIGRSTRSQPGRFNTPRHARRTTGVTGVFLDALHAPKEFCLSLAAVQHTSLSHAASTQLRTRHFLLRLEQLHKSENQTRSVHSAGVFKSAAGNSSIPIGQPASLRSIRSRNN